MEVVVSLPLLDGGLDVPLGAESVARHGKPHGAHARYDAASVLGMRPEVVLYHRQRRVAPTQMKKHDCHLIVPVWRLFVLSLLLLQALRLALCALIHVA